MTYIVMSVYYKYKIEDQSVYQFRLIGLHGVEFVFRHMNI